MTTTTLRSHEIGAYLIYVEMLKVTKYHVILSLMGECKLGCGFVVRSTCNQVWLCICMLLRNSHVIPSLHTLITLELNVATLQLLDLLIEAAFCVCGGGG